MRIYQPTADEADRFPQAMIEGSSEFDWDELPDHLKDVLRGAARAVNEWAEQQENPIAGEVVPDARALLGIAPGFTGGLSTDEYMDEQRGRS